MKIFISYAKQQRHIAEDINAVLSARGHSVFFDRKNLAPGLEYQTTIRRAVEDCEVFVFLISPESVADRRYTLTELGYRERKVTRTSGTLLPVVVKPTLLARIPAYLRTVTLQFPQGNLSAGVADAIDRLVAASTHAPERVELPLYEHNERSTRGQIKGVEFGRGCFHCKRTADRSCSYYACSDSLYSATRSKHRGLRDKQYDWETGAQLIAIRVSSSKNGGIFKGV